MLLLLAALRLALRSARRALALACCGWSRCGIGNLAELAERATNCLTNLGKLPWTEYEQDNGKDQNQFRKSNVWHLALLVLR